MLDRRKQLRLTQETLAKMAHVTPQTISTAELGTKAMRPETILNVCEAWQTDAETFSAMKWCEYKAVPCRTALLS